MTCIILRPYLFLAFSFKPVDPYTSEKSLSTDGRTYVRTYGRTDGGQISQATLGLLLNQTIANLTVYQELYMSRSQ